MPAVQLVFTLWTIFFLPHWTHGFELQDTIHALIEENIHLHDQLENLTHALRELKQLLWNHSKDNAEELNSDLQHMWDEWMAHGVSAETHLLLEHVFCGHELGNTTASLRPHSLLFLMSLLLLML